MPVAEILKFRKDIRKSIPTPNQWLEIITKFKTVYNNEKLLLKKIAVIDSSVLICGDTHGWLDGTVQIIEAFIKKNATDKKPFLIFLGDYTDRGPNQIQNLFLVMKTALEYEQVVLLRGNHDFEALNMQYGFYHEIFKAYKDVTLFNRIISIYPYFYTACVINSSILCVHAGIPIDAVQKFSTLEEMFSQFTLQDIEKFLIDEDSFNNDEFVDDYLLRNPINASHFQIYWNDPLSKEFDFGEPVYDEKGNRLSIRGFGSYRFSKRTLDDFFNAFGLKLLIRGHEPFQSGAQSLFQGKIWSIFSILNYGKPINAKYLQITIDEKQNIKEIVPVSILPL